MVDNEKLMEINYFDAKKRHTVCVGTISSEWGINNLNLGLVSKDLD